MTETAIARRRARAAAAARARAAKRDADEPAETEPAPVETLPARRDVIAERAAELDDAYSEYDASVIKAWDICRRAQEAAWKIAERQVDAAALAYTKRVSAIRGDWA